GKRKTNAPEEGTKSEKADRHSGAGALENLLVAKRTASRIAVEECEKRKEPNLAQLRPRGCHRRGIAFQSFCHVGWGSAQWYLAALAFSTELALTSQTNWKMVLYTRPKLRSFVTVVEITEGRDYA